MPVNSHLFSFLVSGMLRESLENCSMELSRLNLGGVQLVQLSNGTVLGLREKEPGAKKPDESSGSKNKANLSTEIASVGIEHVRENKTDEPLDDAKYKIREALGARTQTPRWDLSYDCPSYCSQSDLVNESLVGKRLAPDKTLVEKICYHLPRET